MLRQIDWAWVALGVVETHHERPVDPRLKRDRVDRIAPTGSQARAAADENDAAKKADGVRPPGSVPMPAPGT